MDSENQQLVEIQKEDGRKNNGRKLGSTNHTPRVGRHALFQATKRANKWLEENGFSERIDADYNVLSEMMAATMIEGVRQSQLDISERDGRVFFAMLKEIAPYTERKLPAVSAEEAAKMAMDGSGDAKDAFSVIMQLVRQGTTEHKKNLLAADDKARDDAIAALDQDSEVNR